MTTYKRIKGGEKNEKTGVDWTMPELEFVCDLYIQLDGKSIHENNPKIHELAKGLGRTVRSVENQLLAFKKVATNEVGRKNFNRLIPIVWKNKTQENTTTKLVSGEMKFRISSALKDIIGQDLITDDHIAVFELVKNSYDAYATRVDIFFEDIYSDKARITITDNGKGMSKEDLRDKWLFVAYSAKREGTEDENFDYRDNLSKNRAFAGAKGIGRFSCDRLGRRLTLTTKKRESKARAQVLHIDWGMFEQNSMTEFIDIGVEYKQPRGNLAIKSGTSIEISDLRSVWDRKKLIKLRSSLSKLINPNIGKGEQKFKIFIHVPEEKKIDKKESDQNKIVNGEIQNFIFETLGLKTTKIYSKISTDGKQITTELYDGGTFIYRISEKNKYDLLDSIEYTLYYLNRSAKQVFKSSMGVISKEYGHIFLYKNGFRVYPYGEPGEDTLKIDARKAQGTRRYLGTRELIGQIEIFSDTDQLKETSSRGDGLIQTESYKQLQDCFLEILKRLEKYVVDVQRWGLSIEGETDSNFHSKVTDLISKLSLSDQIIKLEYPKNIIQLLEASQGDSAERMLNNLSKLAVESKDDRLLKEAQKIRKSLAEIRQAKEEAEKEAAVERNNVRLVEKELEERVSENLFLKSVKSQDLDEVVSFMHSIGISSSTIDNYLSSVYQKLNRNIPIEFNKLKAIVQNVSLENRKILSISRFGTKANFKLYAEESYIELVEYITEYVTNILQPLRQEDINIRLENKKGVIFNRMVRPIELSIVFDNLLNNSVRAKAKNFMIEFTEDENSKLLIKISDDGKGISDDILKRVFEFGFTTTSGSGLGLHHVQDILSNMGADISINNKIKKGVEFLLKFK